MIDMINVTKSQVKLYASIKAVIALFLELSPLRNKSVFERVQRLSDEEVVEVLQDVKLRFEKRHQNIEQILSDHSSIICGRFTVECSQFSSYRKLALGAYFTKEYSFQAAALFNPSIVSHPDQSNLGQDELRYVMNILL